LRTKAKEKWQQLIRMLGFLFLAFSLPNFDLETTTSDLIGYSSTALPYYR
jgi:hypothetical protein